ncbi:MAG: hypothetical protein ACLFU3_07270, partial [Dichotomicrobium sp.]
MTERSSRILSFHPWLQHMAAGAALGKAGRSSLVHEPDSAAQRGGIESTGKPKLPSMATSLSSSATA